MISTGYGRHQGGFSDTPGVKHFPGLIASTKYSCTFSAMSSTWPKCSLTKQIVLVLAVFHVAPAPADAVATATDVPHLCDKTRDTGYNDHRTLHVPAAIWDAAQTSPDTMAWANALCCVFTWITRDEDATYPYMVTYDGESITYTGATTFSQATEASYNAICRMFMGRQDCASCAPPPAVTSAADAPGSQ